MEVVYYHDYKQDFMEIIGRYNQIIELEEAHKKIGRKTWVNPYNLCDGSFMLTVAMQKAA